MEELKQKFEKLKDETNYDGELKSLEEFKEMRRRSHSEPRCKDSGAAELEIVLKTSGILERNRETLKEAWEEEYREYIKEKIELLEFRKDNPLKVGLVETMLDEGVECLMGRLTFEGKSHTHHME